MLAVSFFNWWYGQGWKQVAKSLRPRLKGVAGAFSVGQLLRTLFAPWRRITTEPGRALEERLRAWLDNMISRVIGFFVRLGVLFAAFVSMIAITLITVIEIIAWLLLPLAVPLLIVLGLTNL